MTITYKIHPAIGVARVGNSPHEFFIGPEIPGELVKPNGGFKDAQCRVKRQAARFYVFAHDDVAGTATDVTDQIGDITWRVAPTCNKRGSGDFDEVEIIGRLQHAPFNLRIGTPEAVIPAGEIRSDHRGRLLMLGGFGQAGPIAGSLADVPNPMLIGESSDWWDDTCEGPVFAEFTVDSVDYEINAWMIVTPPKFRPHQSMVNNFYDARIDDAIAKGDIPAAPVIGPGRTAAGLDKAALENVSHSGQGLELRSETATFINFWQTADPLRLKPTLGGDPPAHALFYPPQPNPWHPDYACGWGLWNYGELDTYGITDAQSMWEHWPAIGFMVDQNGTLVVAEACAAMQSIILLTPHLDFGEVPVGNGVEGSALRAIVFEVVATSDLTLEYSTPPGSPFSAVAPIGGDALAQTVRSTGGLTSTVRFWIRYTTTANPLPDEGSVVVTNGTQSWTVTLSALTVPRRVTATALVLDRSGSMSGASGPGVGAPTKHESLVQAAQTFIDLTHDGDFVQLVRYDESAQMVPEVDLGDGVSIDGPTEITAGTRAALAALVASELTPDGSTSIGSGLQVGVERLTHSTLDDAHKALLIMTDGRQNTPPAIADVAPLVTSRTYAIGLGTPENTSAQVLQELSGNHGGYLLVTGAIDPDSSNRFLLQKFFVQIQAGIDSSEVVLDPDGHLVAGREQAIPFSLCDADRAVEVILLCDHARSVDFRVLTPGGDVIEPWLSQVDATVRFGLTPRVAFYRVALPVERRPGRLQQAGTWRALLRIGEPRLNETTTTISPASIGQATPDHWVARRNALVSFAPARAPAAPARLPFSLVVRASSQIGLRAAAQQSGFEPGARVELRAALLDTGVLPVPAARMWAEVTAPDGTDFELVLAQVEPGNHRAAFTTRMPGVYRCRVRAQGKDALGFPFARERTLTAAVWHGGSRPPDLREGCPCTCKCRERTPGPLAIERAHEIASAARWRGGNGGTRGSSRYGSPAATAVPAAAAAASPAPAAPAPSTEASAPGSAGGSSKPPGDCGC